MNRFQTTATVAEHGQIVVPGIPFEPGTEVIVTVQLKEKLGTEAPLTCALSGGDDGGLHWEGNLLVHRGTGIGYTVADLREERLDQLASGRLE